MYTYKNRFQYDEHIFGICIIRRLVTLFSIGFSPLYFRHIYSILYSYPLCLPACLPPIYILFQDAGNICGKLCCLMKFPFLTGRSQVYVHRNYFSFLIHVGVVDLLVLLKMWLLIKKEYFI